MKPCLQGLNCRFKTIFGLPDALRVDVKMSRQKGFDIKPYASLENAKKCLGNADRLLVDALKVSLPTRVALLELGIEEYSKGLIILFNTDLQHENTGIQDFIIDMELPDNLKQQCLEKFKTIGSIKDLNPYDHGEKLKAIKLLFELVSKCYQIFFNVIDIAQIAQLLNGMNLGTFDISSSASFPETIKNTKISGWEKVKEHALYVNLENGNAISPEKQDLEAYSNEILMVFIIARTILFSYLLIYEGKDFKAMFLDPKNILGPFYYIIEPNTKEGQRKVKG